MTNSEEQSGKGSDKLGKELGPVEVYCVATGAMFSSGFFLLPGLAVAATGPSAALAYLIASVLMVPAMFSIIELSTALPRAGGAYYFLDRSLGPAVGTVAGIGIWLSMIFKAAFALVGMGAYLSITPGLGEMLGSAPVSPEALIKLVAVVLALGFVAINIVGARETVRLQKGLVLVIILVLGLFLVQGLWHTFSQLPEGTMEERQTPFLDPESGWHGLFGTVGLVFVSYAGLTKIASISEEIRQPARTLPLAMILSLATATLVYVVGVFIMVSVLDSGELRGNPTPVATAAGSFSPWLPATVLTGLIIAAALAAFASTGNAGLMAASRYPLAMARDRLMPEKLEKLGRFKTPTLSILLTGGLIIAFILLLSTEGVAKLGSSFNLVIFGMANLAVIVMRESKIESYDPGFRVPIYPWMPVAGCLISGWLLFEMGPLSIFSAVAVVVFGGIWYVRYARPKVRRYGAIHHVFARLAKYRHAELDDEFREIIKEKGLQEDDPYDEVIHRADVIDLSEDASFDDLMERVAESFAERISLDSDEISSRLLEEGRYGGTPISEGMVLMHFRDQAVEKSEMVLVRIPEGIHVSVESDKASDSSSSSGEIHGLFALVSPEEESGQHLRFLAQLSERVEESSFAETWSRCDSSEKLKETILRDSRFLELFIGSDEATEPLVGSKISDLDLPPGAFTALVRRDGERFEPRGETRLESGDYLTLIGSPEAIRKLSERFIDPGEMEGSG